MIEKIKRHLLGKLTEGQYLDLARDWTDSGETEPLGGGLSKFWQTSWTDPFFIPNMVHDIESPEKPSQVYLKPIETADAEYYARISIVADFLESNWLGFRVWVTKAVIGLYRTLIWQWRK